MCIHVSANASSLISRISKWRPLKEPLALQPLTGFYFSFSPFLYYHSFKYLRRLKVMEEYNSHVCIIPFSTLNANIIKYCFTWWKTWPCEWGVLTRLKCFRNAPCFIVVEGSWGWLNQIWMCVTPPDSGVLCLVNVESFPLKYKHDLQDPPGELINPQCPCCTWPEVSLGHKGEVETLAITQTNAQVSSIPHQGWDI